VLDFIDANAADVAKPAAKAKAKSKPAQAAGNEATAPEPATTDKPTLKAVK